MASQLPSAVNQAAARLVDMLRAEAARYLAADRLPDIRLEALSLSLVTDPTNGQPGYEGV